MIEVQSKAKPWIGGNWKCNGSIKSNSDIAKILNNFQIQDVAEVTVFPTFLHIDKVKNESNGSWSVGAQNCSVNDNGAFTGEVSTKILQDFGVQTILCGHSERRQLYSETSEIVASKAEKVLNSGLKAVVCIGETLEQRNSGLTMSVCEEQLKALINKIKDFTKVIIAYEPIWAIGTGVVASPEIAEEVHKGLRNYIASQTSKDVAANLPIVYGGSVNAANCQELICQSNIDGFLVGGASLKPEFVSIIDTVQKYYKQ
uniref:Triosephosphate isomerase n=1 Tax=Nephromyces sp. MMRI TaxID=2496275 RepID=A0A3S8V2W8_9APIC|nr:triosephosphate isomerase [Nephromyces sp. MMRI]